MNGNSPASAGVPPTIRGTPLKLHLTTLMLMGWVWGIKGMAWTTSTVELLYSSHSEKRRVGLRLRGWRFGFTLGALAYAIGGGGNFVRVEEVAVDEGVVSSVAGTVGLRICGWAKR